MAKEHRDRELDEQQAEPGDARFTPLDQARWEDSGYLPSGDDQSWREMEAVRIAAYDRIGHLPPEGDQSWREREAQRLADAVNDEIADLARPTSYLAADPVFEPMEPAPEPAAAIPEPHVPVREPVAALRPAHRGAGGVMLLLAGVAGLVTVALAAPDIVTPDFWRAQWAAVSAKPAARPERVASIPAPAAAAAHPPAQSQPAPDGGPGLNTAPLTSTEPPADAAPPDSATPEATTTPQPEAQAPGERRTMVIGQDGTVQYEDARKPAPARRASRHDDRGENGVYAMAPGPDGVLRYRYFPAEPPR